MISEAENRPMGRFFGEDAVNEPLVPRTWSSAEALNRDAPALNPDYTFREHLVGSRTVDVYLSAGPKDDDGSCDTGDAGNCTLYRVRWLLAEARAESVETLVPATLGFDGLRYGAVQPALSGTDRLAWVSQGFGDGLPHNTLLWVGRPGSGSSWRLIAEGRPPEQRPTFPWFINPGELVFTRALNLVVDGEETSWKDLFRADISAGTGAATVVAGPSHGTRYEVSYANPQYSTARKLLVSFGHSNPLDPTDWPNPHVSGADGSDPRAFVRNSGTESCQHPAWSPKGTRVLCTKQEERLQNTETGFNDGRGPGATLRPLEVFREDHDGVWTQEAERLFEPLPYSEYPAAFPRAGCRDLITYKFAHWCGDDAHIVATVYCSDGEHDIGTSRVLLIDITDRARPVYHDLTAAIESHLGLAEARLQAIYSVCSE